MCINTILKQKWECLLRNLVWYWPFGKTTNFAAITVPTTHSYLEYFGTTNDENKILVLISTIFRHCKYSSNKRAL